MLSLQFDKHQLHRRELAITFVAAWTDEILAEPLAAPAHPSDPARRISDHQRKRRHILRHHRAGADEAIVAERVPADDGGIGADAGAAPDRRRAEFILARHIGARIVDVGEHAARAAKHVVGEFDAVIERDIVLDLAAVADLHARADHHVLADRAVLADHGAGKDMAKMPDLGAAPDHRALVDIARDVNQRAGKARIFAHLAHVEACSMSAANGWTPLLPSVDNRHIAERRHDVDRGPHLVEAKAAAGDDFLIAARVQIGEAFGKFDLLAVDRDRTEGGLLALHLGGQIVAIDRQKPAHVGALAFEKAGGALGFAQMSLVALDAAEHEAQHVEEMHADIGGNAARFGILALPRRVIPAAARGDVGQIDLVALVAFGKALAQRDDRRMQPKLQDGGDAATGVALDLGQPVDIPGIEHQRLFADRIRARAQREAAMRVVQIVRRADRHVVDLARRGAAACRRAGRTARTR